jgi:hypothetical protein
MTRFDRETLELLDREREVKIETVRPDGRRRATIVWVVVDQDEAFIRSWKGDRAYWFRAATDRPDEVALTSGDQRIEARAVLALDAESVARCSSALERKYAGDPDVPSMVRPEILNTTLRLEPRRSR